MNIFRFVYFHILNLKIENLLISHIYKYKDVD